MELLKQLPETGYLRLPTVLKFIPVGRSTWFAGVSKGKYPRPVKIGSRISAWRAEDIRALIQRLSSESESKLSSAANSGGKS